MSTRKSSPTKRRSRARKPSARAPTRRAWGVPLAVVLAILVLGWVGTPSHRRSLRVLATEWGVRWPADTLPHQTLDERPELGGVPAPVETWVEPATLAIGELVFTATGRGDGHAVAGVRHVIRADARWKDELEFTLDAVEPFRVGDANALEALRATLEELSFIKVVPLLRARADLGLEIEFEVREPVACIPVGTEFYTVDATGVVLSGRWSVPIRYDGVPLPVIGPMRDASGVFAGAQPGDWLVEDEHLDALDVILSMRQNLQAPVRKQLGRLVVDATRARAASVEEPGVRILLEERRLVLFGRQPSSGEPGELAPEAKWESLRVAMAQLFDEHNPVEWSMVDVRWDYPELRVPEMIARATSDSSAGAPDVLDRRTSAVH